MANILADTDLMIFAGLLFIMFGLASAVRNWAQSYPPRLGAILIVMGGGLLVYVLSAQEGAYTFSDIPYVIYRVIGRII